MAPYEQGLRAGRAEAEASFRSSKEAALTRGYQEGFERGVKDGREQGLEEGRADARQTIQNEARGLQDAAAARVAKLDQLLSALPAQMSLRLTTAEEDMVALCHAIVCRILGEHLLTREGVAHCVRQALSEAGAVASRLPVSAHVHPGDLEALEADPFLAAWLAKDSLSGTARVTWVADEGVAPGGCVLHGAEGTLDARLETQLASLRRVLIEGCAHGRAPSISPPAQRPPKVAAPDQP